MPLARAAAERALSLDPRLGEALAALGCVQSVYDRDFAIAEETFVRAASVDPGNPTVHHWLAAQLLIPLGRFDEAHVSLRRARALDPLSTAIGVTIGLAYLSAGALDDALEVFAQVRALDPHFAMEPYFSGLCHTEAHRYAEASAALERAMTLSGRSAESVAALAQARAAAGNQEGARELLSELRTLRTQRYVSPALFAQIHAMLGELDLAFQHLDEALEVRSADLIWVARRGAYAPLRADARWSGVLTRIYGSVAP
jgi:tetratricopeptide (TPR) repeat protein